jgi:hypothetical protein
MVEVSVDGGIEFATIVEKAISPDDDDWENFKWVIPEEIEAGGIPYPTVTNEVIIAIVNYDDTQRSALRVSDPFTITAAGTGVRQSRILFDNAPVRHAASAAAVFQANGAIARSAGAALSHGVYFIKNNAGRRIYSLTEIK